MCFAVYVEKYQYTIIVLFSVRMFFCRENEHITSFDHYAAQLTEASLKSAEATVPSPDLDGRHCYSPQKPVNILA